MLFFLPTIAIALVAGIVSGGRVSRLALLRFRYGWLIILAFVVQVSIFSPLAPEGANEMAVAALHILSNLALIAAIAANWGIAGMRIVALGLLLNFAAIAANGGFMPVAGEVLAREGKLQELQELREKGRVSKAVLITEQSRLTFLADIFAADIPPFKGRVFSIGDVALSLGAFVLVFAAMREQPKAVSDRQLAEPS